MLPAPVQPEILRRRFAYHPLQRRGEPLRDGRHGIGPVGVVLRQDNVLDPGPEAEWLADAAGAADHQRDLVLQAQQCDRLVRRGRAAKEVHEQAALAGVLVAQGAEHAAAFEDGLHLVEITLFRQQLLPGALAEANGSNSSPVKRSDIIGRTEPWYRFVARRCSHPGVAASPPTRHE